MTKSDINKNLLNIFEDNFKEGRKVYAVMSFSTEFHLNISKNPFIWNNYENRYFINGADALKYFTEADDKNGNATTFIVDGTSLDILIDNMNKLIENFKNPNWLNENVY